MWGPTGQKALAYPRVAPSKKRPIPRHLTT